MGKRERELRVLLEAVDCNAAELLKRAYSLALPQVLGPVNLAMSIDDLLNGSDVYSNPVESFDSLSFKLSSLPFERTANFTGREVLTFEWPNDGRIKHPVRGTKCAHFQCFDLQG